MAQDGDTITYTFDDDTDSNGDLIPEQESVSGVDIATVDFCDGAGGGNGGSGGRVENAEIDVANQSTLYIWVAQAGQGFAVSASGRYGGVNQSSTGEGGGGSTEISFSNTDETDSADEPFLVASGGGAGGRNAFDGARGGDSEGIAPPQGGRVSGNRDGKGAIDDQNRGFVTGGTTITGGGSPADADAEVQITYTALLDSPTNLSVTDSTTEDELTLSWDEVTDAVGYFVYRAESSGTVKSDYTQIADVTAPPYTDTGLEDGERFFYRVSSHD
jgi:hypothetical protein